MTKTFKKTNVVAVSVLLHLELASAAVVVSNVILTPNSITFDLAGTLDGPQPSTYDQQLFITAAAGSFMLDSVMTASAVTFSTTNPNQLFDFYTLNVRSRYPFTLATAANFSYVVGYDVTGTYTATWQNDQFNPSVGTTLNFHWGAANRFGLNPPTGTTLALGVPIPEPATSLLGLFGITTILIRRTRT